MIDQQVSHFRIREKLGAGGMGVVYLADDLELQRTVALKFLPEHLAADDEAVRRFILEAQSASALNHPNVCTIHEIGRTESGQQFIAMALYEGQTLKDRLEDGPIPPDEAASIARQIAEGLEAAHEKGIAHRDIKPANIFLTDRSRAVILDFGLAKLSDRTAVTQVGSTVGTFAYMSPEQARGDEVDTRTDLWSLGAVFLEMLTGRRPFGGSYEQAVVYAILNEDPTGLDQIPDALREVVTRSLEKDPDRRFSSASEIVALLAPEGSGSRVVAAAARPPVSRRNLVLAAAVAAVVIVALVLWFGGDDGPSGPVSVAIMPLTGPGLVDAEWMTEGMTGGLITELAGVRAVRVTGQPTIMQLAALGGPSAAPGGRLDVDYVVEGSLSESGTRLTASMRLLDMESNEYTWGEEFRGSAEDLPALQGLIVHGLLEALGIEATAEEAVRLARDRPVDPEAQETYMRGMYFLNRHTPDNFVRGMQLLQEAVDLDPNHPLPHAALAAGYAMMGHGDAPPHDTFPRGRDAAIRALDLDPNLPEAIGALAEIRLYYDWDWAGAEEAFERALELNPSLAVIHGHYAWYLMLQDRTDEGIRHMAVARSLDPLNPLYATWYPWYLVWSDPDTAAEEIERALELAPEFPWALHVHSFVLSEQGNHDEAVATAEKLAEVNPNLSWSLGIALAKAGRREEALELAAEIAQNPVGKKLWGLPAIYAQAGEIETALDWLERAYEYRLDWLPWITDNPNLAPLFDEPRFRALADQLRIVY